ncbi:hypothetical protein BGX29_000205 [Mortierella sp. GBA35]|nr:hypothetical protein BGX29_000205 [Mortierella sp. GBA35]
MPTITTSTTDEPAIPSSTPLASPTTDPSQTLDPLSHLTHIFDKIRKQVIEWGEDANWKIDVFLLPNEDGGPTPGQTTPHDPQLLSQGPATPARAPRIDLTDSPRRYPNGPQDLEVERSSGARGFALQPPPTDLPLSKSVGIPGSLSEQEISRMSETEAKRMLSLATRQIREQQESLSQAILDLEAMQRHSAKREREAEARLEVEKQIMERDAFILSKKLRETSITLMEKDREIRDVQYQLETGKRLIKERSEERRKRIDEGSVPPRSSSGRSEGTSDPAPGTPGRSDPSATYHQHSHRHVHYHRHHHRHLRRKGGELNFPAGTDSLENLALLASQVLSRDPLPAPKTTYGGDTNAEGERKKRKSDERDRGLQLRPVKRPDLNGLQTTDSLVSNGKLNELESQEKQQPHQQQQLSATALMRPSQHSAASTSRLPAEQPPVNNDRIALNKQRR